jgi:hypothetical protein
MKLIIPFVLGALILTGCASTKDQMYYDAAKAISKDSTVTQAACWSAIAEIAKGGDNGAKVGAIALADKCKNETIKIVPPAKNWLGM